MARYNKRGPESWFLLVAISMAGQGCTFDFSVEGGGLLAETSFVVKGLAQSVEERGSCLVWESTDGRTFVLTQSPRVANDDFDAVTTPGTVSRLELRTRSDLGRACKIGATVAEVTEVLAIEGRDAAEESQKGLKGRVDGIVDDLEQRLLEQGQAITGNIRARIDELEDNLQALVDDIEFDVDELMESIREQLPESGTIRETLDGFVNQLEDRVGEAIDELEGKGDQFTQNVGESAQAAIDRLRANADDLLEEVRDRLPEPGKALEESLQELSARVEEIVAELRDRSEREMGIIRSRFEERVNDRINAFRSDLEALIEELGERVNPQFDDLDDLVKEVVASLLPDLEDLLPPFVRDLDESVAGLRTDLNEVIGRLGDDAQEGLGELVDQILPLP